MEKIAKELLRYKCRSLVEILDENGNTTKFVVCSCFNEKKPMGEKWQWGHYFELWNGTREEMMKAATMYLYDIESKTIPYSRLEELATKFKDGLLEDDKDEAMEYFKGKCEMTPKELEFFGLKEDKFKLVEVTMTRQLKTKIKVIMPEDEDDYNVDDYIDNTNYLEGDDFYNDDWEVEYVEVDKYGLSTEDCSRYSNEEVWNVDDYQ